MQSTEAEGHGGVDGEIIKTQQAAEYCEMLLLCRSSSFNAKFYSSIYYHCHVQIVMDRRDAVVTLEILRQGKSLSSEVLFFTAMLLLSFAQVGIKHQVVLETGQSLCMTKRVRRIEKSA